MGQRRRTAPAVMALGLAAALALQGCAEPAGETPQLIMFRINWAADMLSAEHKAEAHCAKYGKAARLTFQDRGIVKYDCE